VSACAGDACATPGVVEVVPCGDCGTRDRFCTADRVWEYGLCEGEGECTAGTIGSEACGRCGTQTILCDESCTWVASGECTSEGECAPGDRVWSTEGCPLGQGRWFECDDRCTYVADGACAAGTPGTGDSLRVELDWDTMGAGRGDTDLDLHLHRDGTTTRWASGDDDCYFANCTAVALGFPGGLDWGLEPTLDLTGCQDAPRGSGADWIALGACYNPRLETDVITCDPAVVDRDSASFCAPEVIAIDNPPDGAQYRILVNLYSAHGYVGESHPTVSIFCGDTLEATLGAGEVGLVSTGAYGMSSESWLAADVAFVADAFGGMSCVITPLLDATGVPWVQTGDAFGPPWSVF
jgi:hypothetical protein